MRSWEQRKKNGGGRKIKMKKNRMTKLAGGGKKRNVWKGGDGCHYLAEQSKLGGRSCKGGTERKIVVFEDP